MKKTKLLLLSLPAGKIFTATIRKKYRQDKIQEQKNKDLNKTKNLIIK